MSKLLSLVKTPNVERWKEKRVSREISRRFSTVTSEFFDNRTLIAKLTLLVYINGSVIRYVHEYENG